MYLVYSSATMGVLAYRAPPKDESITFNPMCVSIAPHWPPDTKIFNKATARWVVPAVWPWACNVYRIVASVAVGEPINFDIFSGYPRFYDGYVPPLKAKAQPTTHCASKEWAWRDPLVACMLVPFASPPHTSRTHNNKKGGGGRGRKINCCFRGS